MKLTTREKILIAIFLYLAYKILFSNEHYASPKVDCGNYNLSNCGKVKDSKGNIIKDGCTINSTPTSPLTLCICTDPTICSDRRRTINNTSVADMLSKLKSIEEKYNDVDFNKNIYRVISEYNDYINSFKQQLNDKNNDSNTKAKISNEITNYSNIIKDLKNYKDLREKLTIGFIKSYGVKTGKYYTNETIQNRLSTLLGQEYIDNYKKIIITRPTSIINDSQIKANISKLGIYSQKYDGLIKPQLNVSIIQIPKQIIL